MKLAAILAVCFCAAAFAAEPGTLQLPAFPVPTLALENGATAEATTTHLLRELHRAGLTGFDRLETFDADYALLREDSLGQLTAWLDATCEALNYDLRLARQRAYDGSVFARLLGVATSLGMLQGSRRALAMPIGILICQRAAAWGALPADGARDAYVIFATDKGMTVYDPPTRQMVSLADFPNKTKISQIRF